MHTVFVPGTGNPAAGRQEGAPTEGPGRLYIHHCAGSLGTWVGIAGYLGGSLGGSRSSY